MKRARRPEEDEDILIEQAGPTALPGLDGSGNWVVARYEVSGLFSLKSSLATSTVGRTLLIPTPYAVKMGLVDAAFRAGLSEPEIARFLQALIPVEVRCAPAAANAVTHTFTRIRQQPKQRDPQNPYISNIGYREFVHCAGDWLWAFNISRASQFCAELLLRCLPHLNYVGKRGSFIQFMGVWRQEEAGSEFSQPLDAATLVVPQRSHVSQLDDFGPEASLEVLSSFTTVGAKLDRHRKFILTVVPVGAVNSGPAFTEYRR